MAYGGHKLDVTMRGVLTGHIESSRHGRLPPDGTVERPQAQPAAEPGPEDKVSWSLRARYVLCIVVVCAAIGGAIAMAFIFKRDDDGTIGGGKYGGLKEDDIIEEECPEVMAQIDQKMYIRCRFSQPVWNVADKTKIILPTVANFPEDSFSCGSTGNDITCEGSEAKCSHQGAVRIRFDTGHEVRTTLTVTGGHVYATSLKQNAEGNETNFRLTCQSRNTCVKPQMVFSAMGTPDILGKPFGHCNSTFTDASGYNTYCDVDVEGDVIKMYGTRYPKCEIRDRRWNLMHSRNFSISLCKDIYTEDCVKASGICDGTNTFNTTDCTDECDIHATCLGDGITECPKTCYPKWCIIRTASNSSMITEMNDLKSALCDSDT